MIGKIPLPSDERRDKLKQISADPSYFGGMLSLISDIYLPNYISMYKPLLAHVKRDPPDLIVCDAMAFAGIDVAHLLNIPLVLNSPGLLWSDSPNVPTFISPYYLKMNLWERCMNFIYSRLISLSMTYMFSQINYIRISRGLSGYVRYV